MTPFQILFDAIECLRYGRKNAAKSQWNSLTKEFRDKVIEMTIACLECSEPLDGIYEGRTQYGVLLLSNEVVADFKTFIPQLVQ